MIKISDIKERIISVINNVPFKIKSAVLYGSLVRGNFTTDSDIDILFISDEINPKKNKRGKEIGQIKQIIAIPYPLDIMLLTSNECISNFKNHNPLFLDIALEGLILFDKDNFLGSLIDEAVKYIIDKNIKKIDDGWVFPIKEREPVYLSKVSNKDFAIAMLSDGVRDYEVGIKIILYEYYDKAVYHFQQAIEKAIKAILICFGIYRKTHFVGEILLEEIKSRDIEEAWRRKLVEIAKVGLEIEPEVTWSRYPGIDDNKLWIPYEEYNKEDAESIKHECEKVLKVTKDFVNWWFLEKFKRK